MVWLEVMEVKAVPNSSSMEVSTRKCNSSAGSIAHMSNSYCALLQLIFMTLSLSHRVVDIWHLYFTSISPVDRRLCTSYPQLRLPTTRWSRLLMRMHSLYPARYQVRHYENALYELLYYKLIDIMLVTTIIAFNSS